MTAQVIQNADKIIANIDFSLKMEDMPLTRDEKTTLKHIINGDIDINAVLKETIQKYSKMTAQ
jgi:hypothetical protein